MKADPSPRDSSARRWLRRGLVAGAAGLMLGGYVYRKDIIDALPDHFPSIPIDTGPPRASTAPGGGATQVAAGGDVACARLENGEIWCWGAIGLDQIPYRQLHRVPRKVAEGVERVAIGRNLRCVLRADHRLHCRRSREAGASAGYLQDIVIPEVEEAVLGVEHACVRRRDGALACWGDNDAGQLGDGTKEQHAAPVMVPALAEVRSVALGSLHTCALTQTGNAFCWGNNHAGQLGDGTTNEKPMPTRVPGVADATQIVAAGTFSCALSRHGTVQCWGRGNSDTARHRAPVLAPERVVGLADATALAAGERETCALRAGGRVACWHDLSMPPSRVGRLSDVTAVTSGNRHSCALRDDGSVACWGWNEKGQVGADLGTFEMPLSHGSAATNEAQVTDDAAAVQWISPSPFTSPSVSAFPW